MGFKGFRFRGLGLGGLGASSFLYKVVVNRYTGLSQSVESGFRFKGHFEQRL